MAGTVTTTEETYGSIKVIKFAWTSTAGGAADATTTEYYSGKIMALATIPDGTDVPTASYDVVVTDKNGLDVLHGAGVDCSATLTEYVQEVNLGVVANSRLTLAVTNAGNAKKGVVYVHLR